MMICSINGIIEPLDVTRDECYVNIHLLIEHSRHFLWERIGMTSLSSVRSNVFEGRETHRNTLPRGTRTQAHICNHSFRPSHLLLSHLVNAILLPSVVFSTVEQRRGWDDHPRSRTRNALSSSGRLLLARGNAYWWTYQMDISDGQGRCNTQIYLSPIPMANLCMYLWSIPTIPIINQRQFDSVSFQEWQAQTVLRNWNLNWTEVRNHLNRLYTC